MKDSLKTKLAWIGIGTVSAPIVLCFVRMMPTRSCNPPGPPTVDAYLLAAFEEEEESHSIAGVIGDWAMFLKWKAARESAVEFAAPERRRVVRPLMLELKDGDAHERAWAIHDLRQIGADAKQAIPALVTALKDADKDVRAMAVVIQLLEIVKDKRPIVRARAMRTLAAIGPPACAAGPFLKQSLRDEDRQACIHAAYALTRIAPADDAAMSLLIDATHDSDEWNRNRAAHALGMIGSPAGPATPSLRRLLKDEAPFVRNAAAFALARIDPNDADAIAALVESLAHRSQFVRAEAALRLRQIGPAAAPAVLALHDALTDECSLVRRSAADALKRVVPGLDVARRPKSTP